MRGEYLPNALRFWSCLGSPPLARGVPVADIVAACDKRITPACAGSTIKQKMSGFPRQDHPRLRGEYVLDYKYKRGEVGSPPLARGVHLMWYPCLPQVWITPACAGSTLPHCRWRCRSGDHPRLRGEYRLLISLRLAIRGSPPLARGVLSSKK